MSEGSGEGEPMGDDPMGAEPPQPPPPPPPPTASPSELALDSEAEIRSGGIGRRAVAAAVGGLLLIGGVGFAAAQLGGDDRTPEEAVAELFDAIADEDVLGVLATLDPGERDTLTGPVEDLVTELERLEVLDESFELSGVAGVDLEFEDLTFRSEPVRDDLVRVHLTGGTASYAVDTAELPIGDFLADTFDRFGVDYDGVQESDSDTLTGDDADDTFLVVRDTGDGWRVSIGYTAAEAARLSSGDPVPAIGAGLAPIGADSPEDAVDGFVRAAADLDVPGLVARLSPAEFRALQDYWPLLVDPADLPSAETLGVDIEITDLELRSTTDGNRAQVFVDAFGVDVDTGDFRGGGTIAEGCITLRGDARTALDDLDELDLPEGPLCRDDIEELFEQAMEDSGGTGLDLGGIGGLTPGAGGDTPSIAITVTRVDGDWYVAPIRSWADAGIAVLRTIEREDLDAMVDAVEGFFGAFGPGSFEEFSDLGQELDGSEGFDDVFEDFEDFEDFGGSEDFESGLPRPGASDATMAVRAEELLAELVGFVAGDPQSTPCILGELFANASTSQLYELADAYELDFEPSAGAQDVLFAAVAACE